jgi:hypothetical protein
MKKHKILIATKVEYNTREEIINRINSLSEDMRYAFKEQKNMKGWREHIEYYEIEKKVKEIKELGDKLDSIFDKEKEGN